MISTEVFKHTKDQPPRDSQDDKNFPKHSEIIHFFNKYPIKYRMWNKPKHVTILQEELQMSLPST